MNKQLTPTNDNWYDEVSLTIYFHSHNSKPLDPEDGNTIWVACVINKAGTKLSGRNGYTKNEALSNLLSDLAFHADSGNPAITIF